MVSKRQTRKHGGAMPLSYLSRGYTEPSAPAGSNLNEYQAGLARPALNLTGGMRKSNRKARMARKSRKSRHMKGGDCGCMKQDGGFMPSVMGSFLQNAKMLIPAVSVTCYRMWKNYATPGKKTRRR